MMKPKKIIEFEYLTIEESFQPVLIFATVCFDQKVLSAKTKQHQYDTYCMMYDKTAKKSIFFLDFTMKCRII